jgi:quercetin dioxygenase-like cupin family protein
MTVPGAVDLIRQMAKSVGDRVLIGAGTVIDAESAAHSHPHDQMAWVVYGRLRVRAGEEEFEVTRGDSFVIRGSVIHQATALEPSHVIDIFTPYRDY